MTVKHLSSRTISQLPVPLPPLAEQGRIVERIEELFARLDAVDASLASLLEKLETLRSAILADAFHTNRPLPPGW
ncbi:MAG: restriction endonuclease subunit S, partial [Acidimicrobiia bacterium]|nr:restriction endonuclease subunit S [Acidimicrobiia bacterium]